jgi:hypothetical protein
VPKRSLEKEGGHKYSCRAKGQIEIGDDIALPTTHPSGATRFSYVMVLSSLGGDQWQVKHFGSGRVSIVNGADMTRLRPPSTMSG